MSSIKATLKAAKAALDAQNYTIAAEEARKALALDAKNYHAQVFLGLALEKQDQHDASEAAYVAATKIKREDLLAWQGLVSLYEKQTGKKLDEYHDAAVRVAELQMEADDRIRCQSVIDKYTLDAKKYGTRAQYKHSLEVLLPSSSVYDFLEGRIPHPASTFLKIVDIVESEEKEKVNTEIGQRRTRLGATIDQVSTEVRREVFENSPLETLYASIIDWTHDDEVRREYEEKLLERANETLNILPMLLKPVKRDQVQALAKGLVILEHPFLLAWKIHLEWQDVENIVNLDLALLREFIAFFPDSGLAKIVRGFLSSDASPFPRKDSQGDEDEANDDGGNARPVSEEDRLVLMTDGIEDYSTSILSHRLLGQYYVYLEEYESAVKLAREGLKVISSESNVCGLRFVNSLNDMKTILATGLVQYQAPRNHPEAKGIFEDILSRKPAATSALIGIGLIYEEQENYAEAGRFLDQALRRNSDPKIRSEAAWCKALDGDNETGLRELEACLPNLEATDVRTKSVRSQALYRIGMCIWSRDTTTKARKDRNGAYARFLASLKADMNFAPAYTSLGIYYADYAKDRKRARKCFQKAFELSASEVEAAERLAKSFAKSSEWDLVEVVAQRIVDSGKTKPSPGSKRRGISWPHAALGVVQLTNQDFSKSVVSFQAALRISPEDYNCWVGLGESYHNSGRYIAAAKAFEHAEQLQAAAKASEEDSWFSRYMLANVKRELGEFDDAIAGYREVLSGRPGEYGISIALLQCLVEAAWYGIELGFFGRAAERAGDAIKVAKDVVKIRSEAFNLWKAVGDACSIFASVQAYAHNLPIQDVKSVLTYNVDQESYNVLKETDFVDYTSLDALSEKDGNDTTTFLVSSLKVTILAHKRAFQASASDVHARAVAWYNLGWTEYKAHTCGIGGLPQNSKSKPLRFLKAAVQCFKNAIEIEAGNAEFWNSLGIVTSSLNPKVSQHSFVRSLYLNEKNARVWANLGTLYLLQDDSQLANEAFTRAQSADPDCAQAWLGQGMLATKLADKTEARNLFTHAFEIADSSSTKIKQQYAVSEFDHLVSSPLSTNTSDILQPLFALQQLHSQMPENLPIQHLTALFQERIHSFSPASTSLSSICTHLESSYETTESPLTLIRFAQAKADLARTQLASKDFISSIENAETALDLSSTADEDNDNKAATTPNPLRLSAHLTAALSHISQTSLPPALLLLKTALTESSSPSPQLICLLAQILWSHGGKPERTIARAQLLDCLETHSGHVGATLLLGAITVLEHDDDEDDNDGDGDIEALEAVTADLQKIQQTRGNMLSAEESMKVEELLTAITILYPGEKRRAEDVARERATRAVMMAPWMPRGWGQLARLAAEETGLEEEGGKVEGEEEGNEAGFPAKAAVLTAVKAVKDGRIVEAEEVCRAFAGTGTVGDAQRGIMVAPWMKDGWDALR